MTTNTTSKTSKAADGKAVTVRTTFSRETSVRLSINADAAIVWALLTKAADYKRWNSTITSLEGTIALGQTIKVKSTLDAKRTFKLRIRELESEKRMVWGGAGGNRIYTLEKYGDGIIFSMTEKIGGLMFPMYAKMIPSFDESFEQFARDLKKEAETIMNAK